MGPLATEHQKQTQSQTDWQPKTQPETEEQAPGETEFDITTTAEEYESKADYFLTFGITCSDLNKVLENWRTTFNKATKEFKLQEKKRKTKDAKANEKPRKNNLKWPAKYQYWSCVRVWKKEASSKSL